ncbi:hypothetical protein [Muricoccus nepalensis]|nr:hypothetical protein [Roseomonas nepalensis]
MIFNPRRLSGPSRPVRKLITVLRGWIAATSYRPERHYMRGGR